MPSDVKPLLPMPHVQLAAGGIVWHTTDKVSKVAIIHRPRYDDWSLPKGKHEPEETLAETARREVVEELGFPVQFLDFAGTTNHLLPNGALKLVVFWNMAPIGEPRFVPNDEVDDLQWLTTAEALKKLSYATEQFLLKETAKATFR